MRTRRPHRAARLFLLQNSLKFHGSSAPRIRITAEPRAEDVVVTVRDNGIGFEEEYAERIFEMFQRLNHRQDFPGLGVGLALARDVVDRHGGRIWAESKPGSGAAFRFTLPKTPLEA